MRPAAASRLLQVWLSPSFPSGAYAYSHGLESAAASNLVADRAGLESWLRELLAQGSARNDLIVLAAAWRAANSADWPALIALNAFALALQPSSERYLETSQQGGSFASAIAAAWPCAAVEALREACPDAIAYPVAAGVAAAGHAIALADALAAFAIAFAQNLASAAIRLSLIGQTDGQRAIAALMPDIECAALHAEHSDLDDIGGAALSSDLASLEHETLYSRLFRS